MRIVRHGMWPAPPQNIEEWAPEPMIFAREIDLTNFDQAVKRMRTPMAGVFIVTEVFDMPGDPPIAAVSMSGASRYFGSQRFKDERNQAVLYYWNAMQLHERLSPTGVLANSQPHPLTSEQIVEVFEQLAHHPWYKMTQVVKGFGTDRKMVTLQGGLVTVE